MYALDVVAYGYLAWRIARLLAVQIHWVRRKRWQQRKRDESE
jgi:hypothetical protein